MMRRSSWLVAASLLAAALAPVASHGATTRTVEIYNNYFQPIRIYAEPGDTIRFVNKGAPHRAQGYVGQMFDTGEIATYGTADVVFTGGEVGYRDPGSRPLNPGNPGDPGGEPYSELSGTACSGTMCGSITSTPSAAPPGIPNVSTPTDGSTVTSNEVLFSGTALNAHRVRLYHAATNTTFWATVQGGGGWGASWAFSNGPTSVRIVSVNDEEGFESAPVTISFTVNANDVTPPRVLPGLPAKINATNQPGIQLPDKTWVGTGPIRVNGVVEDDTIVTSITATVTDLVTGTVTPVNGMICQIDGGNSVPCSGPGSKRIQYRADFLVALPGYYQVTARGVDGAEHVSSASVKVIILSPI